MGTLTPEEVAQYDAVLMKIDAKQIENGLPILSVLVIRNKDNKQGAAFWDSVQRYNLRLPNESDSTLIERLMTEAHKHYNNQH